MHKITMKGPEGTCSANVMGHEYEVDEDEGTVVVTNPEHVDILKRHGFVVEGEEGSDEAAPEEPEASEEEEAPKKKKKRKKNRD
jgi:hypothetical protein